MSMNKKGKTMVSDETLYGEIWMSLVKIAKHLPKELLGAIRKGGRAEAIALLTWNDPNGVWTDGDLQANGFPPMTDAQAFEALAEQVRACVEG